MRAYTSRDYTAEIPGFESSTKLLRSLEARTTVRSLIMAAVVCLVRAAVLPWVMRYSGPRDLGGPSDLDVVQSSVLCLCLFGICALWARLSPIAASLAAITVFGAVTAYDWTQYTSLNGQGMTSKVLIWIILFRAFMNSILSRTM